MAEGLNSKGKSKGNQPWVTEFNMNELDFNRFDVILRRIDEVGVFVRMKDSNSFKHLPMFVSLLEALYVYMRPLLVEKKREHFDERFESLWLAIGGTRGRQMASVPYSDALHLQRDLLEMRQILGFGLRVNKYRSEGAIKRQMLVG